MLEVIPIVKLATVVFLVDINRKREKQDATTVKLEGYPEMPSQYVMIVQLDCIAMRIIQFVHLVLVVKQQLENKVVATVVKLERIVLFKTPARCVNPVLLDCIAM